MNQKMHKALSRVFRALGSESAMRIFSLLLEKKEACVSDIAADMGLSMSATSHQLKKMEALGLVESIRDGRTICYVLKEVSLVREIARCLTQFALRAKKAVGE